MRRVDGGQHGLHARGTLLDRAPQVGDAALVATTYRHLAEDVRAGDRLLVDDGLLELRALESDGVRVRCEVVEGGVLKENKGITRPGVARRGAAAHGAVAKNGGEGEVSAVRRPGRPRVVHPDVAEFLLNFRRLRREKKKRATPRPAVVVVPGERARYDCAFEDEGEVGRPGGFAPGRLVWGKVRCHPWWPGQVFDPADASEQALEERRKHGATLVAFFWDKTFAWVDADELLPFRGDGGDFALLAGQSAHAMPALTASVDAALGEVARRVAAGLSCCCCCDGAAVAKKQVIENAGIREGAHGATVDAAFTRGALRGEAFVGYVSALAVAPLAGADRLDLAIATAQLKAFDRWRGAAARSLPEYTCHHGIEANAMAPRRKRGRATKNTITGNVDDDASELENFEPTPQPLSHQMSTKIGKLMSRAAQQMSRSPAVIHRDTTTTTTNGDAPPPPPPVPVWSASTWEPTSMAFFRIEAADSVPPSGSRGSPAPPPSDGEASKEISSGKLSRADRPRR